MIVFHFSKTEGAALACSSASTAFPNCSWDLWLLGVHRVCLPSGILIKDKNAGLEIAPQQNEARRARQEVRHLWKRFWAVILLLSMSWLFSPYRTPKRIPNVQWKKEMTRERIQKMSSQSFPASGCRSLFPSPTPQILDEWPKQTSLSSLALVSKHACLLHLTRWLTLVNKLTGPSCLLLLAFPLVLLYIGLCRVQWVGEHSCGARWQEFDLPLSWKWFNGTEQEELFQKEMENGERRVKGKPWETTDKKLLCWVVTLSA